MGSRSSQVQRFLELIQSLIALPEDPSHPVQPFYQSFPEFLTDPTRCAGAWFYISPEYHTELVFRYLGIMDKSLKKNVGSIPDYFLNSGVKDPSARLEGNGIRGALEYACTSWYKHSPVTKDRTADVGSALCCLSDGWARYTQTDSFIPA